MASPPGDGAYRRFLSWRAYPFNSGGKEESSRGHENLGPQEVAVDREKLLEELNALYKELDRLHRERESNAQKVKINKEIRRVLKELLEEIADA